MNVKEFATNYNWTSKISKIENAKKDVSTNEAVINKIDYKIFNTKYCIYTGKTNGLMGRPRFDMMKNLISKDNISLCLLRSLVDSLFFSSIFVSKNLVDKNFYGFQTSLFPLYLYNNSSLQQNIEETAERTPNLNKEIVDQIAGKLGLKFTPEKETLTPLPWRGRERSTPLNQPTPLNLPKGETLEESGTFAPIDILDYIYAVLHSPSYREKYKEFLKIDFPRVPYPEDKDQFWQLVKLGGELRQIHLLEHPVINTRITTYPVAGDNEVEKVAYVANKSTDPTKSPQRGDFGNSSIPPLEGWEVGTEGGREFGRSQPL